MLGRSPTVVIRSVKGCLFPGSLAGRGWSLLSGETGLFELKAQGWLGLCSRIHFMFHCFYGVRTHLEGEVKVT